MGMCLGCFCGPPVFLCCTCMGFMGGHSSLELGKQRYMYADQAPGLQPLTVPAIEQMTRPPGTGPGPGGGGGPSELPPDYASQAPPGSSACEHPAVGIPTSNPGYPNAGYPAATGYPNAVYTHAGYPMQRYAPYMRITPRVPLTQITSERLRHWILWYHCTWWMITIAVIVVGAVWYSGDARHCSRLAKAPEPCWSLDAHLAPDRRCVCAGTHSYTPCTGGFIHEDLLPPAHNFTLVQDPMWNSSFISGFQDNLSSDWNAYTNATSVRENSTQQPGLDANDTVSSSMATNSTTGSGTSERSMRLGVPTDVACAGIACEDVWEGVLAPWDYSGTPCFSEGAAEMAGWISFLVLSAGVGFALGLVSHLVFFLFRIRLCNHPHAEHDAYALPAMGGVGRLPANTPGGILPANIPQGAPGGISEA